MTQRACVLLVRTVLSAFPLAALLLACSAVPDNARIGINQPDRTQFEPVGNFLDHRCGSLDCHGSPQRNLVLWGCEGLRLDPMDVPGCRRMGGKDTTEAELDASFRSLVGLEPAVMNQVVADKGQHPELLTFVRKARGEESHKGGALIVPGDAQDTCITSWLADATSVSSCTQALQNTP
jgi:hypothetical protein